MGERAHRDFERNDDDEISQVVHTVVCSVGGCVPKIISEEICS